MDSSEDDLDILEEVPLMGDKEEEGHVYLSDSSGDDSIILIAEEEGDGSGETEDQGRPGMMWGVEDHTTDEETVLEESAVTFGGTTASDSESDDDDEEGDGSKFVPDPMQSSVANMRTEAVRKYSVEQVNTGLAMDWNECRTSIPHCT